MSPTAGASSRWFGEEGPYGGLDRKTVGLVLVVTFVLSLTSYDVRVHLGRREWLVALPYAHLAIGPLFLLVAPPLINLRRPHLPRLVALLVAVAVACFAAFAIRDWAIPGARFPFDGYASSVLFGSRHAFLFWALAVAAWYYIDRSRGRSEALRETEAAQAKLATASMEARLAMMQAQIEPHFLFNTLAHVRRLYRIDALRARRMLDALIAYLRTALPQFRTGGANLGQEVDLTGAYLEIQQIRMGTRLAYTIDVPPELRAMPFPPLMLLTLVENAVKHGLSPAEQGGRVRIVARQLGASLTIRVEDTGVGLDPGASGAGLGLASIRARLDGLHGAAAGLVLRRNDPHGVVAELVLPSHFPAARPVAAIAS